jgi:diadenosine tetraphosphatase ApaH/serine/threonine PP2A family protein phosphatase
MKRKFDSGAIFLGWLFAFAAALSWGADGPYVWQQPSGGVEVWSVLDTNGGPRGNTETLPQGTKLTIPAVAGSAGADVPAFHVEVRAPASVAADTVKTRANAPLFVVADTHGEYELLVAMLRKHGVIDAALRWSFGRGHLVVLGDVFDRGPNHTEILWLLYELEAQAARAGGGSHLVLGNHETMVMRGDLRYLHPKYQLTAAAFASNYSKFFEPGSVLGQWLRSRPAVLKINDLLCAHGGISPALIARKLSLADVNAGVRAALTGATPEAEATRERNEFLMGSEGPLWYRGYFPEQKDFPPATGADIDAMLKWFGVKRILVGHTIVPTITPLYEGRVVAVQVYPRRGADGAVSFESLAVRKGEFLRATLEGATPLPLK